MGVWISSNDSQLLRLVALTMVGSALNAIVLWNFFPMHMRGAERTFTDTMHLILAANPFVLLGIVFCIAAFRNWFRPYSAVTVVILLAPAIFAFSYAGSIDANQPTPGLGLAERAAQYAYQVWQVTLVLVLFRRESTGESSRQV
jgi:hypothetical protein